VTDAEKFPSTGPMMPSSAVTPPQSASPGRKLQSWGWTGFALFVVLYLWLHFYLGTQLIHQTNQDRLNWDQQHNITLAFRTLERESAPLQEGGGVSELWKRFPHYTDGVVNPLWPWVAARFTDQDHDRFFEKGKWFNLILAAIFLVVLGTLAARAFSIPSGITTILLAGLGAVLPRSVYFQPETLFYLWLLIAWVCCLTLLRRNDLWLYGALGASAALSYLAKGSTLLLLVVFVGITTLRFLIRLLQRPAPGRPLDTRWSQQNHFIGMAVMTMTFLMFAGPMLSHVNTHFGSPLHSYPSSWMWVDSFEEGSQFMVNHPDKRTLDAQTPEERPGAMNYFKHHTAEQMWARLSDGVKVKLGEFLFPKPTKQNKARTKPWHELLPNRGLLLFILLAQVGILGLMHQIVRRREAEKSGGLRRSESAVWMLLFALGCFAAYSLAYGWYTPVGKGDRFMLSLYAPMVLTCVWLASRFRRRLLGSTWSVPADMIHAGTHAVIITMVLWRIKDLLTVPLFD